MSKARARARAIEAIEIETEMDIAMLSEANEADKALPFSYSPNSPTDKLREPSF